MRHSETRLARNSSRGPVNEVRSPAASDVQSLMTQKSVPASRKSKPRPGQPSVRNKPVVGHVIGVVRYAQGDTEGGQRCTINYEGPNRSKLVPRSLREVAPWLQEVWELLLRHHMTQFMFRCTKRSCRGVQTSWLYRWGFCMLLKLGTPETSILP